MYISTSTHVYRRHRELTRRAGTASGGSCSSEALVSVVQAIIIIIIILEVLP